MPVWLYVKNGPQLQRTQFENVNQEETFHFEDIELLRRSG